MNEDKCNSTVGTVALVVALAFLIGGVLVFLAQDKSEPAVAVDPSDYLENVSNITVIPPLPEYRGWVCYDRFNETYIDCFVEEYAERNGTDAIFKTGNWTWYRCIEGVCSEVIKFGVRG